MLICLNNDVKVHLMCAWSESNLCQYVKGTFVHKVFLIPIHLVIKMFSVCYYINK